MLKPLWLALAAVGLWASLLPQISFVSASSGEPSDQILIAWPGWGVQQDLGRLSGTLGTFHVWVSAEPRGDHVTVQASLVDAATNEVLRQTSINAAPDSVAVLRTLDFPAYVVPEGQRLILQLQAEEFEHNYVIYRLSAPNPRLANVAANGVPDVGKGPLAFAHIVTGSGIRGAVHGDISGRIRLILGGIFGMLTILSTSRVAGGLRSLGADAQRRVFRRFASAVNALGSVRRPEKGDSPSALAGVLRAPWYPWPASTVPVLHFLTSNPRHFSVTDTVIPLGITLGVVTVFMISLRFILKDWHRSAGATLAVTMVFFSYGHFVPIFKGRVDERVFFAGAIVLCALVVSKIVRSRNMIVNAVQPLNLTVVVLLAFPITSLIGDAAATLGRSHGSDVRSADELFAHLLPEGVPDATERRPDIFYIILDEYARHDALGDFDNSGFLSELHRRGFYVATEATSNYMFTQQSLASTLNMSYLDDVGERTPSDHGGTRNLIENNAIVAILKQLGYEYVHLGSGHYFSTNSPLADIVVTFKPSGTHVDRSPTGPSASDSEDMLTWRFVQGLIQTTALSPLLGQGIVSHQDHPYSWWSPRRALSMFEFLAKQSYDLQSPKYVFAHITKPHSPASFDRYGNYLDGTTKYDGFSDSHDPSVPDAYSGQLIYINSLVLMMVDEILRNHDHEPIIVLAADHGRGDVGFSRHDIFAAFHLPGKGDSAFYSSISSVNHWRVIFDYYFGLGLGLLEDRRVHHEIGKHDFRETSR